MFGMLDYRAHKLYWLLSRPLWLLGYILLFVTIACSAALAFHFFDNVYARFAIAYLAFQILGLLLLGVVHAITWLFDRIFLFIVDLVPADGRTPEEAKFVLKGGAHTILLLKPPSQWSDEDFSFAYRKNGWLVRTIMGDTVRKRQEVLSEKSKAWAARADADGSELNAYQMEDLLASSGISTKWYEHLIAKGYCRWLLINHLWFLIIFYLMQEASA